MLTFSCYLSKHDNFPPTLFELRRTSKFLHRSSEAFLTFEVLTKEVAKERRQIIWKWKPL